MEKSVKEVFNEIQTTIEELRAQLDELEEKLEALKEEAAEPIAVAVAPEPEPDPEPVDVIPEPVDVDLPSEETDPFVAETPRDDIPVIPSEVADEAKESEPESPIDLSIDMASIGAKTVPDAKNYQWMIDLPGGPVANVISAISLNDRVLFINTLFKEDPALFQNTISEFNKMESISEAVSYVIANFPDWNLNSEVVYRLMMAVRRKLK